MCAYRYGVIFWAGATYHGPYSQSTATLSPPVAIPAPIATRGRKAEKMKLGGERPERGEKEEMRRRGSYFTVNKYGILKE